MSSPSRSRLDPARGSSHEPGSGVHTIPLSDTTAADHAPAGALRDDGHTGGGDLAPGDRAGPYEIEAFLARGGFGDVYRARDPRGEPVAIKVLREELATTTDSIARFEREVDAVARVQHASVIRVLGRGRLDRARPFFAMELLHGLSLADRIALRGAMPATEAIATLDRVCDALAAAHERGIVHRDIKASNVFLAGDGERVVLLDFGVAKLLGDEGPGLTRSRQIVGTPACMAPEQLAGEPVDQRTDVYALGVLGYHMLTGTRPFANESPVMLQHLHRNARRPRPSAKVDVPEAIDRAVVAAMAVDPAARPAGARRFMEALRGLESSAGAARDRPVESRGRAVALVIDACPATRGAAPAVVLTELERVLDRTEQRLRAEGFHPLLCASRTLAYAKPVTGGGDPVREAQTLAAALRACAPESIHIQDEVHAGDAHIRDGKVVGGPVCNLPAKGGAPTEGVTIPEGPSARARARS